MENLFTPGPWAVCDDWVNVYAPESDTSITDKQNICSPDEDESMANALLIAAAPDLYANLVNMLNAFEPTVTSTDQYRRFLCDEAKVAIARVKAGE